MSFRAVDDSLGGRLADLEREVRSLAVRVGQLERRVAQPDPGWELVQVGTTILFLYVPTGTAGPVIGLQ